MLLSRIFRMRKEWSSFGLTPGQWFGFALSPVQVVSPPHFPSPALTDTLFKKFPHKGMLPPPPLLSPRCFTSLRCR